MDWKFWQRRQQALAPAPNVYEITPKISLQDVVGTQKEVPLLVPAVSGVLLKRMKWVMHGKRVAIFWDLDSSGNCTLHYVGPDGSTVEVARARVSEIRLARYLEIPKSRREHLSQVQAAALGYF